MCWGSHWALLRLLEPAFVTSSLSRVFQGTTHSSLLLISGIITSGPIHSYSLGLCNSENVGTNKCTWIIKEA